MEMAAALLLALAGCVVVMIAYLVTRRPRLSMLKTRLTTASSEISKSRRRVSGASVAMGVGPGAPVPTPTMTTTSGSGAVGLFSWRGRHVVVTGGSSGIGFAIAEKVLRRGASVTLLARDRRRLEEGALELARRCDCLRRRGGDDDHHRDELDEGRIGWCSVDVADYSRVRRAVESSEVRRGRVGVVVCSAGMSAPGIFCSEARLDTDACTGARAAATRAEREVEMCRNQMRINWEGSVNTVHACLGSVTSRPDGRVVLISCQAGQVGLFGYAGYSSSKFALRGFAEALQMEVLPHDCRVCVAYPPDTDTPQLAQEESSKPEELKAITGAEVPFKPERVATAIVRGIERGDFCISVGFDGWMLGTLTAGMSPASHGDALGSLVGVCVMGLLRTVALVYIHSWYNTIIRIADRRRRKIS